MNDLELSQLEKNTIEAAEELIAAAAPKTGQIFVLG